jgi:predicted aldo/keto reductase-like oxidoreductase
LSGEADLSFSKKIELGRTGLMAGRLGISSSFGADTVSYEEAFERGCNYFTWGTFIKGRSRSMRDAIRNICQRGQRDQLIVSALTYAHSSFITDHYVKKGLKQLGIDCFDVLILGYFSRVPARRIINGAQRLKEKGLVKYLGLTSHQRKVFPQLVAPGTIDIFHLRYNAAHRGAEKDVFPHLPEENPPGIVTFTATRWGRLLDPKRMPEGTKPLSALDCYRFVLSHPAVDVCMMGAKTREQMRENLKLLESGPLTDEEMNHIREVGDYVYQKKKS